MAEALKRLRADLDEYRASARPRARPLRQTMTDVKEAFPSAFDEENEKKNGPHEQEAYDLDQECEEALKSARTPSTGATTRKRSRSEGEATDLHEETKCALFSSVRCPFLVASTLFCD
jgi:hypothetical protein